MCRDCVSAHLFRSSMHTHCEVNKKSMPDTATVQHSRNMSIHSEAKKVIEVDSSTNAHSKTKPQLDWKLGNKSLESLSLPNKKRNIVLIESLTALGLIIAIYYFVSGSNSASVLKIFFKIKIYFLFKKESILFSCFF